MMSSVEEPRGGVPTGRLICFMFCALTVAGGCKKSDGSGSSTGVQPSTPKAAAISFFKALAAGDLDGVRASSTGFDEGFPLVGNVAASQREEQRFDAAMSARFKDYTKPRLPDVLAGIAAGVPAMKEVIDGDTAKLLDPAFPNAPFTMGLKREAGNWKMDLTEPVFRQSLVTLLTRMGRDAKAFESVTPQVEQGKFKSQSDAQQALNLAISGSAKPALPVTVTPSARP